MSILDQIITHKYREVEKQKLTRPVKILEQSRYFKETPISLKNSLRMKDTSGIIAEFKRKSPSKGIINSAALPAGVCQSYYSSGASSVSVLTDTEFFGGSLSDLETVRNTVGCPVLRKDFIVDEYQLIEARASGADAVLLIAEVHESERLNQLHQFARSLGLEVLVEVHDEKNISRIPDDAEIIGINSRNLGSFTVNLDHLGNMMHLLPEAAIKVAESGIRSADDYINLKHSGFDAFLIGELFMSSPDPGNSCRAFINSIKKLHPPKQSGI